MKSSFSHVKEEYHKLPLTWSVNLTSIPETLACTFYIREDGGGSQLTQNIPPIKFTQTPLRRARTRRKLHIARAETVGEGEAYSIQLVRKERKRKTARSSVVAQKNWCHESRLTSSLIDRFPIVAQRVEILAENRVLAEDVHRARDRGKIVAVGARRELARFPQGPGLRRVVAGGPGVAVGRALQLRQPEGEVAPVHPAQGSVGLVVCLPVWLVSG